MCVFLICVLKLHGECTSLSLDLASLCSGSGSEYVAKVAAHLRQAALALLVEKLQPCCWNCCTQSMPHDCRASFQRRRLARACNCWESQWIPTSQDALPMASWLAHFLPLSERLPLGPPLLFKLSAAATCQGMQLLRIPMNTSKPGRAANG